MSLEDVPGTATDVEDYVSALFRAAGWCVESGVVLRDDGTEILELDTRAVYITESGKRVVLGEAKSGDWGAPDVFKLLGWKTYLGADAAVFASKKPSQSVTPALTRHAKEAGVELLHLDDPAKCSEDFAKAGFGVGTSTEIGLWRIAAMVERKYRGRILQEAKERRVGPSLQLKEFSRLVGERVLFLSDPAEQALELYAAHDNNPKLALALAEDLAANSGSGSGSDRLQVAMRTGSDSVLHSALWCEYRSRLALIRAAVELAIEQRRNPKLSGTEIDWNLFTLRGSFHDGLKWLGKQPTFWRYPALLEQFCWTWGGFLLTDRTAREYEALSASSGVPVDEIAGALETFDRLFPTNDGWFRTPGPTRARRLMLFPYHFHGVGVFRRRLEGWELPPDSTTDHTGADVVRWNNATVELIGKE